MSEETLEAGDVAVLALSGVEKETKQDQIEGTELQLMLGSGKFPALQARVIGLQVGDGGRFEWTEDPSGGVTVTAQPTQLDDVVPGGVASILAKAGVDCLWQFVNADSDELVEQAHGVLDPAAVESLQIEASDKLAGSQPVAYEIVDAYRWRDRDSEAPDPASADSPWPQAKNRV